MFLHQAAYKTNTMTLSRAILIFTTGIVGGAYIAQNYKVG